MKYKLKIYVLGTDEPLSGEIDEKEANNILERFKANGFECDFLFATTPSLLFVKADQVRFFSITPLYPID